jgi:hypothetical protein
MPISIGADQFRRYFRAIYRSNANPEGFFQNGNIETAEMENLRHVLISKQFHKVGRARLAFGDLHNIRASIPCRQLDDTKSVPVGVEPERFGINGNAALEIRQVGEIILMNAYGHSRASS